VISVEVLDHPKAITTKLEVIGIDTGAIITKVECSLSWIWGSWIAVWYEHLSQRKAIEQASSIISNVMESETLSVVEANSELPFLPGQTIAFDME
jgi:hypothetical protein